MEWNQRTPSGPDPDANMPSVASLKRELADLKAGFARLTGPHIARLHSYRTDPSRLMHDAGFSPDIWQGGQNG